MHTTRSGVCDPTCVHALSLSAGAPSARVVRCECAFQSVLGRCPGSGAPPLLLPLGLWPGTRSAK